MSLQRTTRRCDWADGDDLMAQYHDEEWGVPLRDEHALFECLTLEGAQAGLSWLTVLRKREAYRRAFAGFDPYRVASYGADEIYLLLVDSSVIRHRGKLESTVNNARVMLDLWEQGKSLSAICWEVVDGRPLQNQWTRMTEVPGHTELSLKLSKRLKKLGFRFVGDTTCYAFMQAAGLVNDHLLHCPRHRYWSDLAA